MILITLFALSKPVDLPYVGTVVDRDENHFYQLFQYPGFVQASVYEEDEEGYTVVIGLENLPPMLEHMTREEFNQLLEKIREKGEMPAQKEAQAKDTRLFLMPTANTLDKGRGCFADYELFFLERAWGLSDKLMLSGGLSLFPVPLNYWFFYGGVKMRLASFGESSDLAAGAHIIMMPFASYDTYSNISFEPLGLGYCVFTSRKHGLSGTVGAGIASGENLWFSGFGGIEAGTGRLRFMSEYWEVANRNGDQGLEIYGNLIWGFRISGDKLSGDIGLAYPDFPNWLEYSPIGLPIVSLKYKF